MRRKGFDPARKAAYIFAALFPDRLSLDAAELIASRLAEIDGAVVEVIRKLSAGGRLEREHVRAALNKRARRGS